MKKRQIIVNRKFQFSMAFSFAALSALIMTIVIIILAALLMSNNTKLQNISLNQQQLADSQTEIFKTLIGIAGAEDIKKLHISTSLVKRDNVNNQELIKLNNSMIQDITLMNSRIVLMLIVSAVIQSIIIFYIMLKRSHRISGPIFLLNRYIDEIKNGKHPEIRPLRANDDFHDLFDNFRELAEKFRQQTTIKEKTSTVKK